MINKKHLILYFIILATFTMKAQKGSYMELSPDLNLVDSYKSKIDGIEFSIAIDTYHKKLFVVTRDPKFKLNGKSVIVRTLSSFKNKSDIKLMRGKGYYLKLDEDWYAGFSLEEKGGDDSKVTFVFQYKI